MRWPFRHKTRQADREDKEQAKQQLEVAKAIEEASRELAHEHRWFLYNNHFGPNAAAALKEGRRRR